MELPVIWFVIVAIFWVGFFVLEGFDFGVGVLHRLVGKDDVERRVAINSIGPFWDANEVWLIVGGAAIFAAFPGWYATMFSSLYLALVIILIALIIRGCAFEFRSKRDSPKWRSGWSWALAVSSMLIPLLLGVGFGDLLAGLPIDENQVYTGTFWNLLTPYGLVTGVTWLALCLAHGASFLALKTTDSVRERSVQFANVLAPVALVLTFGWVLFTVAVSGGVKPLALVFQVLAILGAAAAVVLRRRSDGDTASFTASVIAVGGSVASLFASLYPNVMVSSTTAANNLTVENTASGPYSLQVMTVVAVIMFPIVLLYQGWTYYVFRKRVMAPPELVADVPGLEHAQAKPATPPAATKSAETSAGESGG